MRSASRIVGRRAELAQLHGALATAADGRATLTLLGGDAGGGKTRLLEELVGEARATGWTAVTGSCVQVGDYGLPYLPVIDLLRQLEAHDPALLQAQVARRPALASLLPHLAGVATTGELLAETLVSGEGSADSLAQGLLFEAVLQTFVEIAATTPLLLVVEDLHWADRSTRDLLGFVARALREARVAVVASYRTDDLHRRHPLRPHLAELNRLPQVEHVTLPPLSVAEVAELVEAITGTPPTPQRADELQRRSDGNPFYAEQLIDEARAGRLPTRLADVLLDRVTALPEEAQQVLRVAAVAGRTIDEPLLAAVAGLEPDDLVLGLRSAREAGLLALDDVTGSYTFRHALLQEAVYSDLLPGERTRLHARVAGALLDGGAGGSLGELAHHQLAARQDAEALGSLVAAARQAEHLAGPSEGLQHLEQALAILDRLGGGADRLELLTMAAASAFAAGETRRAVTLGRASVAEADERAAAEPGPVATALRAATRERTAHYLIDVATDDGDTARLVAAEAGALVTDLPESPLTARVLATWARTILWLDPAESGRLLEAAIAVADRVGAQHLAADAMISRALLAWRGAVTEDAGRLLAEALERAGEGPAGAAIRLRALRFIANLHLENDTPDLALAAADAGVGLARETGLMWTFYGVDLHLLRGWALMASGRWDEVVERATITMYEPAPTASILGIQLVAVLVARQDPEAPAALARLRSVPDVLVQLQLDVDQLRLHLDSGRPEQVVRDAVTVRAELDGMRMSTEALHLAAVEAAAHAELLRRAVPADGVAAGTHRAALAELRERADHLADTPMLRGVYGRLLRSRVLAESDDDVAGWDAMLALAEEAARVPEQAYALARGFEARLRSGLRDDATLDVGRRAEELADRLGARALAERVAGEAARARLAPSGTGGDGGEHRPRGRTGPGPLTAREQEVLELVAEGASNGDVGRRLYITTKTASVHVSHIIAKLNAANRVDAVAIARRRGLLPR
ncbi:hypothetical protein C8046_14120 [Serinibacter arcticus]|uniref:HTH luxR-type domain-containing protein n=1 Tax=Serinibacter arcticus TaxID=1655435 RepID=A0A2U1ZXG3_9MICO|nr:LuxR family transcriptional regulator [Serinibacter arcticus]PWD51612.1 hypothetical protein C8046_14120 [Serinibacter arcticus]